MVVLTQNIRCKSIPSKNKDVKIHTKLYFRKSIVAKLKNHITRTSVDQLYLKKIFAYRKKLPKTKTSEYYVIDLLDCKVKLQNELDVCTSYKVLRNY